jgi:tetratricopeptide (TPR) repeat protein
MEQKALAREFSYRRKERFQLPLAAGLASLALALLLPPPRLRRRSKATLAVARAAVVALACLTLPAPLLHAQQRAPAAPRQTPAPAGPEPHTAAAPAGGERRGSLIDELLLRPRRVTARGRDEYARGSHPQALAAFEEAAGSRPGDPAVRFNVADGLYKNGRYDEAGTLFKALGAEAASPLAFPSRYNLGNTLYQKQDYKGAIAAYRDALRLAPDDADTRRNLELALRKLKEQEEQKKREQEQQDQQDQQKQDQQKQGQPKQEQGKDQKQDEQQQREAKNQQQRGNERPQTPEEKADQRFRQETGMPRERAMQLLDALQQNEKAEQRKLLAQKRAQRPQGSDW